MPDTVVHEGLQAEYHRKSSNCVLISQGEKIKEGGWGEGGGQINTEYCALSKGGDEGGSCGKMDSQKVGKERERRCIAAVGDSKRVHRLY